jgi:hypothetical protein
VTTDELDSLLVDGHIAHHGTTMAEVASTDPAIAETVIGDNEEDESKVRGEQTTLSTTPSLRGCIVNSQ